jgi:hypothetical protein
VGNADMAQKKLSLKLGDKSRWCFRQEGNTTLFSVADFIRINKLRDDPQLRRAVIEEVRDIFPEARIVEEEN